MFKVKTNKEIGAYLSTLIEKRFASTRQFGKACLELAGLDTNDDEL